MKVWLIQQRIPTNEMGVPSSDDSILGAFDSKEGASRALEKLLLRVRGYYPDLYLDIQIEEMPLNPSDDQIFEYCNFWDGS
jgi:uncharacterized protein YutD